jgi:hypothetical protein
MSTLGVKHWPGETLLCCHIQSDSRKSGFLETLALELPKRRFPGLLVCFSAILQRERWWAR